MLTSPATPVPMRLARVARPALQAAAVASGAGLLLTFALPALAGHVPGQFDDYADLLSGAQALASGHDPYGRLLASPDAPTRLLGYAYPPLVAWLLQPFAGAAPGAAAGAWLLLLLVASVGACVVAAQSLLPASWPRTAIGVVTAAVYVPATYNLWHGNVNPVVALAVVLAARAWVRGEEVRCGALIGAAAAIKLSPILLLALLVRRRWWRGLATGVAVGAGSLIAGALLAGPASTVTFFTRALPVLGRDDGWVLDQSWNAVANRLAARNVLEVDPAVPLLHAATVCVGLAAVIAVAAQVRPQAVATATRMRALEFGAGVAVVPLAAAFAWYEQWETLVVPVAAAITVVVVDGRARAMRLAAALATLVVVAALLAPPLLTGATSADLAARRATALWWPWLQLTSLPALALTWLLVEVLGVLRRGRRVLPPAPATGRPDSATPRTAVAAAPPRMPLDTPKPGRLPAWDPRP